MKIIPNFIVFEGIDGAGTTTQCKLITEKIENTIFTFEPTNNTIGHFIRQVLKSEKSVSPVTLAHLFAADRAEHVTGENSIPDLCKKGKTVICDRYLFSSIAYQSLEVPFERVIELNKDFPIPGVVFFIDTPVEVCMTRIGKRKETELFEKKHLLEKIRKNYLKALEYHKNSGTHIYYLDGCRNIEELLKQELQILKELPDYMRLF